MAQRIEIPALIDMHAHLRQFGQEDKERMENACKSAFVGGFRTICAMPNTIPAVDSVELVKKTIEMACYVRVLPIACVTKNLNSLELVDFNALKNAGAIAFSNDGLPILDKNVFYGALKSGELIISHCEDETTEVEWQIEIFKTLQNENFTPRLHFAHVSKAKSIALIREAKKTCKNLTCETCPHYFTFTSENVTQTGVYKMNPPLGTKNDMNEVIKGVQDGTIDVISTDNAPHKNSEKLLPYDAAPCGITGFETAFSLTFMKFGLEIAILKMAKNPAKILRIENNETIFLNPDEKWVARGAAFQSLCKVTPYEGMEMEGKIYERAN